MSETPYRSPADKPEEVKLEWWEEKPPTTQEEEVWVKFVAAFIANSSWSGNPIENADLYMREFRKRFSK